MTKFLYHGEYIELDEKIEEGSKELDILTTNNKENLEDTMDLDKILNLEDTMEFRFGDLNDRK